MAGTVDCPQEDLGLGQRLVRRDRLYPEVCHTSLPSPRLKSAQAYISG